MFSKRPEFFEIYAEQLARWKAIDLNASQKIEVTRLVAQLDKLRSATADILALADQLKDGTIGKVLGKSDLELGLEALQKMKF